MLSHQNDFRKSLFVSRPRQENHEDNRSGLWKLFVRQRHYTEHVNFAERENVPEAKQMIDKEVSFKVQLAGDTPTQTGQLLGRDLKEVYKRAD